GRLARNLGWMTLADLRAVLREQRTTRKRFGEIAVGQNYLTQAQVYALLALQREPAKEVTETLHSHPLLTPAQVRRALATYDQSLFSRGKSPFSDSSQENLSLLLAVQ